MTDQTILPDQAHNARVTLTIDGRTVTAARHQTVLEAATENGIYIPTLCYLKRLSPIGSCRICLVEVEGKTHPLASCQLPVVEGMIVTTQSERLREARRAMVQLILVNHPLDCPVCERSGECRLQNITVELGITRQTFQAAPVARQKHMDWGVVRYNPELCVLCERCVRACNEIQGVAAYRVDRRGYHSVIDTHDGQPLNCDFCGQCISACPVGALTSGLKLQARSWELNKIDSICPYCGTGCAVTLEVKKDRIFRVSTNDRTGINQGNLCARGRFGFQFVDSDQRLQTPLIRRNGQLTAASWEEALDLVAITLQRIQKEAGGQAIGGIGSERLPNEDNFIFRKFLKTALGATHIDHMGPDGLSDNGRAGSVDDLLQADLIVTVGVEPAEENPVIGNLIRRAMRTNNAALITLFDRQVRFKPHPAVQLTHAPGREAALIQAVAAIAAADDPAAVPVEDAAALCAVPAEAIRLAGARIRRARSVMILCGRRSATGADPGEALPALAAPNVKVLFYSEYCNSRGVHDMGLRSGGDADPWASARAGQLKALYIMGEDPLTRGYCGGAIREALQKVDFIVVQDMFLTPTAAQAHVVLPTVSFAEREGTVTNLEGRVQKLRRAVSPRGKAKPDWQIIALLEKRLSGQFAYDSPGDIFKEIAATLPAYRGLNYAAPDAGGCLAQSEALRSPRTTEAGIPAAVEPDDTSRPFTMLHSGGFFHLGPCSLRSPALMRLEPECRAQINPRDAAELHIQTGDRVSVASAQGTLTVAAEVTEKIAPGTVAVAAHFETAPVNLLRPDVGQFIRVNITKAE